jgi:hypothetical protein
VDCREFDEQVVRLERIKDIADQFVLVRITQIEGADLNLFEFDLDLTMMVFFLNADEEIYGRYGGRDASDPDGRQSLLGLRYAMAAALKTHRSKEPELVPVKKKRPLYVRDLARRRVGGRCFHCHQAKEMQIDALMRAGKWERDDVWQFPLPDNLGLLLEVDRGNIVKGIEPGTLAARVGLKPGDEVVRLNDMPIHSLADAQYALEHAPKTGTIGISWLREGKRLSGKLTLAEGWRRTDISWRASVYDLVPRARLYGKDLTAKEKKALDLPVGRLAFRQKDSIPDQALDAGIRPGDIILGVDDKACGEDVIDFLMFVRHHYLVGDTVTVQVLRDGKHLNLPMKLR